MTNKQDRKLRTNITLRRVRVTIVATKGARGGWGCRAAPRPKRPKPEI
jgi:hypothetical protein